MTQRPKTARRLRPVHELLFVRCPRRVRRALRWRSGSLMLSSHHVPYRPLALLVGALLSAGGALANPSGAQVVSGTVDLVSSVPHTLDIRQSTDKAIINWTRFSIDRGETVNFIQPSLDSVTLNRVLGNDPSAIFGQLKSNGTVMLINPNGIVFGPSARVDVGGLVATTANLRDDDFLSGRYRFGEASTRPQARVVNQGEITIRNAGLAALVAPSVQNSGVIQARLGRVVLGGVSTFTLDFQGDGLLSFSAGQAVAQQPLGADGQPVQALVDNTGTLRADGGTVLLSARAVQGVIDRVINTTGLVSATTVAEHGGRIVLGGGDAGQVVAGGTLDASGRGVGQQGGRVQLTGEQVQVAAGATLDVSGSAGGGEIAIGSQGVDSRFADKSRSASVAAGAQLNADALDRGQGGRVTVWSQERTQFAGTLSARGGAQGGDGGFAEVSSKRDIVLTGHADLRAPHGATGALLLDPTSLRITDNASGGNLDGNAADGQVGAADADSGANTVSRGLLESLAGNANVTLQATGQITIDSMAGSNQRIDLQTTAGNTFTLQSTQSGGIRFVNAATEIRTQGGNITLDAQGVGSTLGNIGKLSSNGGDITLKASGDVQLAGALDAGSGAVDVRSTAGSISRSGGSALLSGGAVSLSAPGGHIGAAGQAITTHTAQLTLSSGGDMVASSDTPLASLSISTAHVVPADAHAYQVTAPGLGFDVSDGAALAVTGITQSTGLDLSFTSDRSLQLGTLDVGTGTLTLASTGGDLLGAAGTSVRAASLVLSAQGSSGSNGAIGSAGQALLTTTGHVDASAGSGGVNLGNTGALALDRLSTTGNASISASGTLTAADVNAGSSTLALRSTGGSVLDDGSDATRITAGTLNLTAGGAIGSSGTRVSTNATVLTAEAGSGGIYADTSATSSTLTTIVSGNGAIDIRTGGSTTLGTVSSTTSSAGHGITITATGPGSISVGSVDAGALGDVTLSTPSGSITGGSGTITGETVTLRAGGSGGISATTAAAHLDVQAGGGDISLAQTGSTTLDRLSTTGSTVSLTNSSGNITVGSVSTASGGQVTLTASAGAILDDGDTSTRISTGSAALAASGAIGSSAHPVQTQATGLSLSSTGDLVVSNSDATLTSLSITNRHTGPGNAATLQVDSPYLTFDVTDTGTSYSLDRLVSVPLASLSFDGDTSLVIGQVQASGPVSLASTQGSLVDDGNLNTRVTATGLLSLSAAQGSVGSSAHPIAVNAAALSLTTRGDLVVSDLADLSSLTISSSHPDGSSVYDMAITAPSLKFVVTDSAYGHQVDTLTDTSSLNLDFNSDRDITLGRVDLTNTGSARFASSAGAIRDDADKSTRVLANSASFSGTSVGAAGSLHLDVVTGTLAASASAGGVYVEVPMPTGSTNTTSTVTLDTITAAGPVSISALEGDLALGGYLTATDQAVSLRAAQGSIFSPSGYTIGIGSGSLTLEAAKAIGTSSGPVWATSSTGATLTAQAGTALYARGSGPMTLSSLDAGTGIVYTQDSGDVTLGHVDATAGGTVAITAGSGSILDDGSGATGVRAHQVSLSAPQGGVGSAGSAVAVDTPQLLLNANGDVNVADGTTLDTLSLTRGYGSAGSIAITAGAGQTFTITEDGSAHHLQSVDSSTPLAFSFSGQRDVTIGQVDVGSSGSARIASAGSLVYDGQPGFGIAAGTVALTAGSTGSIGSSDSFINLSGTTALAISAGRDVYVAGDSILTDLAVTSTNTTTEAGTASVFNLSGLGQLFGITDSGSTQSLDFGGLALVNASFTTRKNITVSSITATGDVMLSTSGGGANSNIASDGGSGRIAGNRVLLTASSDTAGGGNIGSSGAALRVDAPTVILSGSGNVYVHDAQNLARLDMTVAHGTDTTFGYGVTAGNLNSFSLTDGNTQSLGMGVSGSMDFAFSTDRALSLATIDTGTSSTGSISLTSRGAPTGTGAQINRSSGTLTGGTIALSATGFNGGVGAGAMLSTNTQNLSIASGGNVSVSNSTTLSSLALDAQHHTSGSSTHSYSISSNGLTFSISDSQGSNAFQLTNIAQSGLDLSVKADRVITAGSVNTGAGGKVTLHSSSFVQGGSGASAGSPSITTGDLTLNGGSAFGYQGSTPLYTAVGTLSSNLGGTLYLSNAGALTLEANTVGSSADVASSNNSLLQGADGLFTAPTLKLSANQSIGSNASMQTDARQLTLVARHQIDVTNASDLYALSLTSTHATPGVQNTVSVTAPRLALTLTDSAGGDQYHLSQMVDSSGLDFTLSTDVDLSLGTVTAQAGRALALYSTGTGTSIVNDGSSLLTAGSITLSASGSVGAAGSSATRLQTDALALNLTTGADAYVDNAQDLNSLSLTSTQAAGGSAPVYEVSAPSLSFDITDDGTTHVNQVADSTGLNFALNTQRSQALDRVDVGRSGTVSFTSAGDIEGDADSSHRVSAGSAGFHASNGGAIGSVGLPIRLSAPLVGLAPTGALNVESDTHIDRLDISVTHPTATYGGLYSIVSVPLTGAAYPLFVATDSVTGTALTSLADPLGLAFSFTSDRAMQVGTLDLGITGSVALTGTGSGGILGDGDPATQVQAASLAMASYGGAVGAAGSGNGIDATVNELSATAQNGGVYLALHGRTTLGSLSADGGLGLSNTDGDIALGSINVGGHAATIDNQGGSILSGSVSNTTTLSMTASGSIGNESAIHLSANGGGTTTLTASASAAHGASGSIAVHESYNLAASSVTAPSSVTLSSSYALSAGSISSGDAVALESSQGSITGINGSNSIAGTSVSLSARYGTGSSIGSSGTRLNVNSPALVLNTPGSVYVTDSADLARLTVDRSNRAGTGSSGTLSVIASGLTLSATDAGNTTTITTLSDGTGLDFSYLGIGALRLGSLNVGSGSVLLQAYLNGGDGHIDAINGSSLVTAGSLTLQAFGSDSHIGTSGNRLGLAVGALTAQAGSGGIALNQAGSLNLSSINTSGDLAINASSGDLTLGTLGWGSDNTLDLRAGTGRILAGGGTLAGGSSDAAITLTAAQGIGTADAPILVNASAGHTVQANVTGSGSLYLDSLGTLNGGLSTSVHDGATTVTAAGAIKLSSMSSGTDAAGNDIRVTASAGDITAVSVSGGSGASFNAVDLSANAGRLLAAPGATLEGYAVTLHGASGVGTGTDRVSANGQRVQVSSDGAAIYLTASTPSVLSSVASHGGAISITHAADLQLANAVSDGGAITVSSSTANADLFAGNLNAGSGAVTLSSSGTGGTLQDDGNRSTVITGGTVNLTGAGGVGTPSRSLQTSTPELTVSSGSHVTIDDSRSGGVTLASVVASNGSIAIGSDGPMTATLVQAPADGSSIQLSTRSGDLTVASVTAGGNWGNVELQSAGSILGSGAGTHVTANALWLNAGAGIGVVTNPSTGAGSPLVTDVRYLLDVTIGSSHVASVQNVGTGTLSLNGGNLTLGSGVMYLSTAGDLGVDGGGLSLGNGSLSLDAAGTLTLPDGGISTAGALRLIGGTDIVNDGATPRTLQLQAAGLVLRSGSAGGATTLATTTGVLDAALTGAGDLTVHNTGTLATTTLATHDGDITVTSSSGLSAGSVVAGGNHSAVSLSATSGDLTVGTIDAGSNGSITLAAAGGSLTGNSASLTAQTLDLSSAGGIGSEGHAFELSAANVSAQVTASGGIHLAAAGALTLGTISTHDGDIAISSQGDLVAGGALSAGGSGNVQLHAQGGDVTLSQAYASTGNDGSRAALTISADHITLAGVTTAGTQSYTATTTTLGGNLTGASITIDGNALLAGGDRTLDTQAQGGDILISGTLAGATHGATLNAGTGQVTLQGAASGLASLSISGAQIATAGVATAGAQHYSGTTTLAGTYDTQGGAFSLTGATQLAADTSVTTAGGAVGFSSTLDGAHALTISSDGGDVAFNGAVGAGTRVGALVISSDAATTFGAGVAAASLSVGGAGTLAIDGGSVNTTGTQFYGETVVLGTDTTLAGSTVTLNGAEGSGSGTQSLAIAGNAVIRGGGVGQVHALRGLSVSGSTSLNGGTLTTTGTQHYAGAVTLLGDVNFVAGSGNVSFDGSVGGAHALAVDSSGITTFGGSVSVASVTTDAGGSLELNGGSVSTTGAQVYGEAAVLGADLVLSGSSVTLGSADGAHALTVHGSAVLGTLGADSALSALTASGPVTIHGNVSTSGAQQYGGSLTLGADATLHTGGGNVAFTGTVDGAHALAIDSGTGNVSFGAAVGGTTRLGALSVQSSGATAFAGSVAATSVSTDAGGTLALNGGQVDTTGAQVYRDAATLGADTLLQGSTVTLASADGAHTLAIQGDAVLGTLGAASALQSLSVSGSSTLGGNVSTSGGQAYAGGVTLGHDVALHTPGGSVSFAGTVDGAHALAIDGAAVLGTVGGTTALTQLSVSGSAVLNGNVSTTGTQHYEGAATLGQDLRLAAGGSGVTFSASVDGAHALAVDGNAVLGTVGAGSALSSLDVGGSSTFNGNITTTGTQRFEGAVTLGQDATLSSGSGNVEFGAAVNGAHALAVNSSGTTRFDGSVTAASLSTDAAGQLLLNGGSVSTTGAQTYGEQALLGADTTLSGSSITLAGVDGAHALAIDGAAVLGTVGGTTALTQLSVSGSAALNGNVSTTGTQHYEGAATLGQDLTLAAGGSGVTFSTSVDGAHALAVDGNAVLGTVGAGSALSSLDVGGSSTLNGNITTTGTQRFEGAVTLGQDATLSSGSGNVEFAAAVNGAHALAVNSSGTTRFDGSVSVASLSTDAAGQLLLNGGSVSTTGAQTYGEQALLGADTTLSGSSITLAGVDGAHALAIDGAAVLGTVGGTTALTQLSVSGSAALNGNVSTTGTQHYEGAATLGQDLTLAAGGSGVTFSTSVDGAHALAVDGNAVLGTVGAGSALSSLDVGGSSTLNGSVTTTGTQRFEGAVTLGQDATLSSGSGNVEFGAAVNGAHALAVNSSGTTRFDGSVTAASLSTDAAGQLLLNGGSVSTTGIQTYGEQALLGADTTLSGSSITLAGVDGAHALAIDGAAVLGTVGGTTALTQLSVSGSAVLNGNVSTAGTQHYEGAATLGQDLTLAAGGSGVTFSTSVDGAHALTVDGNAVLGEIGTRAALSRLTVAGSSTLNGNVSTSGAQRYEGAVTLGADLALTAGAAANAFALQADRAQALAASDSDVSFGATVDGAHALTIDSGAGDVSFAAAVGSGARIGALTVHSSGTTTLAGAVRAASVSTDAAGRLALNGGAVSTTGAQRYGEHAQLGADTTLSGPTITLAGADGAHALAIDGAAVLGAVGATTALTQLSVSGPAVLNGPVSTSSAQQYEAAVTLGQDVALNAGGPVTFSGTVDGAHALSIDSGSSDVRFQGAIGSAARLGELSVRSSGTTRFDGPVAARSVSTDAAGRLVLAGGAVDTTAAQSWGETAELGQDTTLRGSTVSLLAGAEGLDDSGPALHIEGDALLQGPVGARHALAALSITGAATLAGGSITTAGDQSFGGAVMLQGDQQLHSSGGAIHFASTLDATNRANLTLAADAGAIGIDGAVGAQAALGALTVSAGTTLDFGSSLTAYRLTQTGAEGLAHYRGAVLVDGQDGITLTGQAFAFDQAVTASAGALHITHRSDSSSTVFAREAAVSTATGFTQVGGGSVQLPASVMVTEGPISLEAPALLYAGEARIETWGDITMTGLSGTSTTLTLASGHGPFPAGTTPLPVAGKLKIGLDDGRADHQINVAKLVVPDASAASLFGIIGGQGGALAASRIDSRFVNDPFYINLTPWGPVEVINLLISTTVPTLGVPSTPGAGPLFQGAGAVPRGGVTPNALTPYLAPPVLEVLEVRDVLETSQRPKAVDENAETPL